MPLSRLWRMCDFPRVFYALRVSGIKKPPSNESGLSNNIQFLIVIVSSKTKLTYVLTYYPQYGLIYLMGGACPLRMEGAMKAPSIFLPQ
jgi:hypothetical protein